MSHLKTLIAICALAVLTITGCSGSTSSATPSTKTSQASASTVIVTETVTETAAPEQEESYVKTYYEASEPDDNDDKFEVCGRHAGRATTITSCKFSNAVSNEQRSSGRMVLEQVYSPVTHKPYDMTCAEGFRVVFRDGSDAPAIRCFGGNHAEVLIF